MGAPGSTVGASPPPVELPGFSGATHLYHLGATDFFLDYKNGLQLTTEQVSRLMLLRQTAHSSGVTTQRAIGDAELETWQLTGADRPDIGLIEAKVREIEKLRADQRVGFIRAVGAAAVVLTEAQRSALVGHGSGVQIVTPVAKEPPVPSAVIPGQGAANAGSDAGAGK